jgi:hypothetical protein
MLWSGEKLIDSCSGMLPGRLTRRYRVVDI